MKKIPESFRDAVSFLTVIPLPCPLAGRDAAQRMGRALTWFPLVGGFVGALGGGIVSWASSCLPLSVSALLGLLGMAVITGGLHLDGFTDAVDGLSVPESREEKLRVMGDSRIGAIGAVGLFIILGLKWALIQEIPADRLVPVLAAACCLGRWAMVVSAHFFPYVPGKSGLGRLVTDSDSTQSLLFASLLSLGLVLACVSHPVKALLLMGVSFGFTFLVDRFFMASLGGITGDTLGAVNEMVEVCLLLFLAGA